MRQRQLLTIIVILGALVYGWVLYETFRPDQCTRIVYAGEIPVCADR